MKLARIIEFLISKRSLLAVIMLVLMAALVLADIILPPAYTRFPWEAISGFAAFFGFVACAALIFFSRFLGEWLLYRDEDYYDDHE